MKYGLLDDWFKKNSMSLNKKNILYKFYCKIQGGKRYRSRCNYKPARVNNVLQNDATIHRYKVFYGRLAALDCQ
jgi:hypothetical protein